MWPFSSKKHSRQTVFLYDGRTWYGRIFTWRKRSWECIESVSQLSQSPWKLPGELLSIAATHSVRRVRALLPNDVHSIQIELPSDIEPEEIHTALAYEVANEVGLDAHMVRLAAVRTSQFRMGGQEDALLATGFEEQQLVQYNRACKKEGLDFDGIGALELAALNCHARREPNARLLLLRPQSGFYVTPGTEAAPFSVQSVSFGVEPLEDASRDEERISHAAKRFRCSKAHVRIWCTQMPSEIRKQQLQNAFGSGVGLEYVDFADQITEIATHAAWQGQVGQVTCGCALVAMRKVNKSPYRVGTWLFLMILAMTGMYIGLRWHTFQEQLAIADQRATAWSELQQERKRLAAEVNRYRNNQSRCVAMEQLMQKRILPQGLEAILGALEKSMPPYTRITSIVQTSEREFEISGTTHYQEGLIGLNRALRAALTSYGFVVEPGQIKSAEDSDIRQETQFICRIVPKGGRL